MTTRSVPVMTLLNAAYSLENPEAVPLDIRQSIAKKLSDAVASPEQPIGYDTPMDNTGTDGMPVFRPEERRKADRRQPDHAAQIAQVLPLPPQPETVTTTTAGGFTLHGPHAHLKVHAVVTCDWAADSKGEKTILQELAWMADELATLVGHEITVRVTKNAAPQEDSPLRSDGQIESPSVSSLPPAASAPTDSEGWDKSWDKAASAPDQREQTFRQIKQDHCSFPLGKQFESIPQSTNLAVRHAKLIHGIRRALTFELEFEQSEAKTPFELLELLLEQDQREPAAQDKANEAAGKAEPVQSGSLPTLADELEQRMMHDPENTFPDYLAGNIIRIAADLRRTDAADELLREARFAITDCLIQMRPITLSTAKAAIHRIDAYLKGKQS